MCVCVCVCVVLHATTSLHKSVPHSVVCATPVKKVWARHCIEATDLTTQRQTIHTYLYCGCSFTPIKSHNYRRYRSGHICHMYIYPGTHEKLYLTNSWGYYLKISSMCDYKEQRGRIACVNRQAAARWRTIISRLFAARTPSACPWRKAVGSRYFFSWQLCSHWGPANSSFIFFIYSARWVKVTRHFLVVAYCNFKFLDLRWLKNLTALFWMLMISGYLPNSALRAFICWCFSLYM